jgi:hypothetical protein
MSKGLGSADLGDPDRDRTAVPMHNELRDREPLVSPAQPLVQDVVSVGEAQASIDVMEKGLPWMAEVQGLAL